MDFPVSEIEEKLGYTFKDKELLKRAFVHASKRSITDAAIWCSI